MTEALSSGRPTPSWLPPTALVFGAAVVGLSPILVRMSETGPAAAGFWRLTFALPFLAVLAARTGRLGRPPRMAVWAGVFFALDLCFWHYGIRHTSVANATVLSNLTPVAVTLIAWLFLGQRPRGLFLLAIAAAVGGAWLMTLARATPGSASGALGDALSTVTAFWYALYFLAMAAARRTTGASVLMFWATAVCAPLMLAASVALGEPLTPAGPAGWAACVGLGLMHVFGQGAIAWAMGRLPASTASVVVLIQPVVASGLGWLLFHEAIGPMQAFGGAVTLAGVVLAHWASRRAASA